jgi:hypothetical protein
MGGERARDLSLAIMYDADVFHIGLGIALVSHLAWFMAELHRRRS